MTNGSVPNNVNIVSFVLNEFTLQSCRNFAVSNIGLSIISQNTVLEEIHGTVIQNTASEILVF